MNASIWEGSTDSRKMLEWVRRAASGRKLRLFACAFWHQHGLGTSEEVAEVSSMALEFAERWAESGVRPEGFPTGIRGWHPLVAREHFDAASWTIRGSPAFGRAWMDERAESRQVELLREVFGNPFRPVAVDPLWLAWNNGTVVALAKTIYENLRWDLMPILGDALEDAGCHDEQVLSHCRAAGPHVRGCWVVDLLLDKE